MIRTTPLQLLVDLRNTCLSNHGTRSPPLQPPRYSKTLAMGTFAQPPFPRSQSQVLGMAEVIQGIRAKAAAKV
jgi:hypothetical protein